MTVVETQDVVCPEASSPANALRDGTSLLGPLGRGMRLKVSRDNPRICDIIKIASRRCLVGSAPTCNVRVDEPGVAPIECLIIQGSKNNVVRWLDASQEFTGGELFEDEILLAGDPLQIGPVELELLVDEIMPAEELPEAQELQETSEDRLAEYTLRLERLEIQLIELQQASELSSALSDAFVPTDNMKNEVADTISDLSTQLAVLQSRSASDRQLWVGERAELEALLQSRLREFDFLQEEVQHLHDELVTVRSEFGNRSAGEDTSERLVEASRELAARTEDLEQQRANWERDRCELQRQLQQNIERIGQFETELAQRQAKSEAARQSAEARADRLQESVEALSKRLAEQQENFEKVHAAWEADRASLKSQLAETKQRLAQSETAESAGLEWRETWDRERTELKRQVAEAILKAEETQQEFEAQRRQSEERHAGRCESRPEDRAMEQTRKVNEQVFDGESDVAPRNPMDRLLAGGTPADDRSDEDDNPLRDFLALQPMTCDAAESENLNDSYSDNAYRRSVHEASDEIGPTFSGLRSAAHLEETTADERTLERPLLARTEIYEFAKPFESTASVTDEGEEAAFEIAPSAPPVNAADVLARWSPAGVWSDDETAADCSNAAPITDAGHSPEDALSRFAMPEAAEHQHEQPKQTTSSGITGAPATLDAASDSGDEEESIEAYMARLMNRVRGTDDHCEPNRPQQSSVERSPVTEYTEVAHAVRPDQEPEAEAAAEAEEFDPEQYKPRSQAPEIADRMTAMRSLANDSARTAIASHAKRNWSSVMKLKLLVSVFAFVSVLASIIFFWGDPVLMGLGSLAGVGVLAYWANNAFIYRKLLLESIMLESGSGDYAESASGDETAELDESKGS